MRLSEYTFICQLRRSWRPYLMNYATLGWQGFSLIVPDLICLDVKRLLHEKKTFAKAHHVIAPISQCKILIESPHKN